MCHRGYTFLNLLMVMLIVSSIVMLSVPIVSYSFYRQKQIERIMSFEIINAQLLAIAHHKNTSISHITGHPNLYFNHKGNINQAQTISYNRMGVSLKVVIFLGLGRFEIK